MKNLGHEIVGACEIDRFARQIYAKNFGKEPSEGDAREINPRDLPDFDLLTAGFPCQPFSIAGKRKGFEDTRGTLFFEIIRIAKEKKPRFLLLENVKGLLNHDRGRTFEIILQTLDEIGYNAEWQVLDSKYFVPQRRERLFIIGYLGEKPRPKIFPIKSDDIPSDQKENIKKEISQRIQCEISCIGTRYGALQDNGETYLMYQKEIADCLQVAGHSGGLHTQMTMLSANKGIRRLTPLECERLQAFPDGWTQGISDTQRYKCLGNAVTVSVVEFILGRFTK